VTAEGLFLEGAFVPASGGATFPVFAPDTGAVYGHAARGTAEDADRAVRSAFAAKTAWARRAPGDRERFLLAAADVLERQSERFVDLVIDESGSTITKARYEVVYAAALLRAAAGESRRLYGDTFPNDREGRLSFVLREPLGVVAALSPFNAPLALFVKMVAFPLAAGNTVVAKPSEETPLVALELARVFQQVGLPAGVFHVVTGFGSEEGEALVGHPGVAGIAFTGSTATGVIIGAVAAKSMKRTQLELGGKNALLVLEDFDPEAAADIAIPGAFTHAGQICMASSRILVHRSKVAAFTEAFAARAARLSLGDLRDEKTFYGPVIHGRALTKVATQVEAAAARGARIVTGGAIERGLTYRPTVLLEPPRGADVWRDETFGPVASVVAFDTFDEALHLANDTPYGLSAAVLTHDVRLGFRAAQGLRAGSVHIGMHSFQSNALAPIGGYGMSGVGRSGGKYSTEAFTDVKWVSLELGGE
jgi:acyl-CoA reductase-like NAD-dependent aldehyde dehydrogenase